MSDSRPQRPPAPKHVPFWPVLVAVAFMVAIVISGIISSNHARGEHLTIVTSTLPPRGKHIATTTTLAATAATTPVTAAGTLSACSSANLVSAAGASGNAQIKALGTITAPQFNCVSGYALARLVPSKSGGQSVTADYKLVEGTWALLNVGEVNPLQDGVPTDIAAQLTLS